METKLSESGVDVRVIATKDIALNSYNPNDMDAQTFSNLVNLIQAEGMQQPILVREILKSSAKKKKTKKITTLKTKKSTNTQYEVIDGEHRLKASITAGLEEVVCVVVAYDDDKSKFKTVSMNEVRGEYIPLKMANLLADLSKRYDEEYIVKMTGMKKDTIESLSSILNIPDFEFDDSSTITSMEVSRPIAVNLMLMPDEHSTFDKAITKAMILGAPNVIPLIAEEVGQYDYAMTTTMDIVGTKLRNVGLSTICAVFNALPKEQKKKLVEQVSKNKEEKQEDVVE